MSVQSSKAAVVFTTPAASENSTRARQSRSFYLLRYSRVSRQNALLFVNLDWRSEHDKWQERSGAIGFIEHRHSVHTLHERYGMLSQPLVQVPPIARRGPS